MDTNQNVDKELPAEIFKKSIGMMSFYSFTALIVTLSFAGTILSYENISIEEQKRKTLNEKYDIHNLRYKNEFVIDISEKMLEKSETRHVVGKFNIAKVPPRVKLQILPDMKPEYFPEGEAYMKAWANWAHLTRSDDNRFYFAVSNHRGFGCQINLYEYCHGRDIVYKVLDVDELLGWTEKTYTDGKIHGHMGIMQDGTLWGATHYGVFPDSSWWANGYRGSWLFSYNIYTHEAKNWGIPLIGNYLPSFSVDTRRGILFATGANNTVLCWDCNNKKVLYAGYPPNGWIWWRRAMFCDIETGKFWGKDESEKPHKFISFDPEYNRFERYNVSPPKNPYTDKIGTLRGHTDYPAMDGRYYWSTGEGAFFAFKPEGTGGPIVELLGTTWDKGGTVQQMALDPSGRYVYYYPQEHSGPVIQYDVKTGEKKVLCWLQDYYFEKYGYFMDSCYSIEISNDGSFVVLCMNGTFQGKGIGFGHPSLVIVEIPAEERLLD